MKRSHDLLRRIILQRSKRNEATGCLEWGAASNENGYGRLWDGERLQYVHRLAYEVFVGPIPPGLDVLHNCPHGDTSSCVEQAHLWCGTHQENMADRDAKGRGRSGGHKLRGRASKTRGTAHPKAKVTERIARDILGSSDSVAYLSRRYGVSGSLVRGIKSGRNWGWLEPRTLGP